MSFGLPLRDEGDEKCLSILNSVEEIISRQLRACKAQALSKKKTLEGISIKCMCYIILFWFSRFIIVISIISIVETAPI